MCTSGETLRPGSGGAAVRWADEGGAAARRVNGVDRLTDALEPSAAHPTHAGLELEPASSPLSSFSFPPAAAASSSASPATRAEIDRLARGLLASSDKVLEDHERRNGDI